MLDNLITTVTHITRLSMLDLHEHDLFKASTPNTNNEAAYVLATSSTIFHPQGGGQPSDTGIMKMQSGEGEDAENQGVVFDVKLVRKLEHAILHCGFFRPNSNSATKPVFSVSDSVIQTHDSAKRNLHSRLHTAGHILGLAVRELSNAGTIPPIEETKANHAPNSASCEFRGLIAGEHKDAIQAKVRELVERDLPVHVYFWDEERVRAECTSVPDALKGDENDGVRVVEVEGVGAYPCGGTHVGRTKEVGDVVVRSIKRQKGTTKVSYDV
ncbi:hypothetical protein P7C71_g5515, partial [Lecanoromycetidae sp. Uapishka_2]